MRRRDFIKVFGGAAAWPLAARAQQQGRMRSIGFLWSTFPAADPEGQARGAAFVQGLQELGWSVGRNLRIENRWGLANVDRLRKSAEELVALAPDVLFAAGNSAAAALQYATRSLPIVFANVPDPVGAGYVQSLARPGGNATGFMTFEYSQSVKWLELLKQISPSVARVAILRAVAGSAGPSQFAAIQVAAPLLGVEVIPVNVRSTAEIDRAMTEFAHAPNGGLIVTFGYGLTTQELRGLIALAAHHRLPAVYPTRNFVNEGGLVCYGPDIIDLYRRSASYVDRLLSGNKPSDLPVQGPTKYQMVLNLKTAKALGLAVPPTLYALADEVIE